jgi:hypothetical protein
VNLCALYGLERLILNAVEIMTILLTPLGLDVRGMSHDLPLFYGH